MSQLCVVNAGNGARSALTQPCNVHGTAVSDRQLAMATSKYLSEKFPTGSSLVVFLGQK